MSTTDVDTKWLGFYKKWMEYKESQIFEWIRIVDYYFWKEVRNQTRQQEAENLWIVFWKKF